MNRKRHWTFSEVYKIHPIFNECLGMLKRTINNLLLYPFKLKFQIVLDTTLTLVSFTFYYVFYKIRYSVLVFKYSILVVLILLILY